MIENDDDDDDNNNKDKDDNNKDKDDNNNDDNDDDDDKDDFQSKIAIVKNRLTGNVADNIKVAYSQICKRIGCNNAEWGRIYGCFKDVDTAEDEDLPPF